jgi:hypothetical protein
MSREILKSFGSVIYMRIMYVSSDFVWSGLYNRVEAKVVEFRSPRLKMLFKN